jgi:hypothetical protein
MTEYMAKYMKMNAFESFLRILSSMASFDLSLPLFNISHLSNLPSFDVSGQANPDLICFMLPSILTIIEDQE